MKQIVFLTNKTVEEACNITGQFWLTQVSGIQILEDAYYENNRVRLMRISHTLSLMSYGEDYHMLFERLNDPINQTRITISISLKFGYGAQWKKPSDLLKRWAAAMQLEPIDFGTKPFVITWAVVGTLLALLIAVPLIVVFVLV